MQGDKFQLQHHQPQMLPHKCASCWTNKDTDYIDFGFSVPRYGRVYFCIDCFDECNDTLFKTTKTFDEMLDTVNLYSTEIGKLKEDNANLRSAVNDLNQLLSNVPSVPQDLPKPNPTPKRGPGRPKGTKPRVTQSNSS